MHDIFFAGLSISPLSTARFQGSSITFTCVSNIGPVGSIQWFINGTLLQDPPNITITMAGDTVSILVIFSVSDDITIQCTSTDQTTNNGRSDISTLSVQGMLVL